MQLAKSCIGFVCFLVVSFGSQSARAQSSAPNIIIILADVLGFADVGFIGRKHLLISNTDRISKHVVVITKSYVS